jgi:DNA-binding transcriptional LysR family regulator
MSLSQLENLLDIKLFDRIGKKMKLNENGYNLLSKATQVIEQVNEIESYSNTEHETSGAITIGASTTIASYILPEYIARFQLLYPNINIELISKNSQDIITMVESLNCDVGFIESVCKRDTITTSPWKKDFLKVICNDNHDIAKKTNINLYDTMKYDWAVREPGSGTFESFFNALPQKITQDLKTSIVLNNSEAIKQYVINSQSLACISSTALYKNSGYIILDIDDMHIERYFYKLSHNKKYHAKITKLFCEFVSDNF